MPDSAHRVSHSEPLAYASLERGDIEDELFRLVSDPSFFCTERNKRFLEYVVRETLCGRGDRIKAYSIAVDVFGRPANFDPATDPIVRIEATRLRAALSQYYQQCKADHRIRIELPKGHYIPSFRPSQSLADRGLDRSVLVPVSASSFRRADVRRALYKPVVLSALAIVIVAAGVWSWFANLQSGPLMQLDKPGISIQVRSDEGSSFEEAQRFQDTLTIALAQFQSLRVDNAIARRATATGTVTATLPKDHFAFSATYRRAGNEASAYWELFDSRTGMLSQAGETRIDGSGNQDALVDALASRVAAWLAADRGIINGILAKRDDDERQTASRCFASAFRALESASSMVLESAKNCLNATLRRAPSSADTYALLALVELRSEQAEALEAAVAHSEKAVALEPSNYLSQTAYMQAQFRISHFDAAIAAGRRAIQANPFDPAAKAQLGSILFRRGNWDEGLLLTKEAVELDDRSSRDTELTYMLDAYRRGAFDEALSIANAADCEGCVVKDIITAASLARTGRASDAMNEIAEIRRKHPDFDLARDLRANGLSDPLIEMIRQGIGTADPLSEKTSTPRSG